MNEHAHDEKCLYPPIQKLMGDRGYEVICQFETFSPLARSARKLDVLGFRWTEDGDLDAWAVEGKQGELPADTLTALGQAIEYQLYVPRVSVAAEVSREDLAFAENPLRQLGLGYIHATPASATEIIAPVLSPRCYQNEFNQVVRHAGVLCLIGRKRWEDHREHHAGGGRGREDPGDKTEKAAGYPFYCIHNNDPVQYMLTTTGESRRVSLEIWIDRKPVLTDIYATSKQVGLPTFTGTHRQRPPSTSSSETTGVGWETAWRNGSCRPTGRMPLRFSITHAHVWKKSASSP